MQTWYEVPERWGWKITPVEVVKHTEHSVFVPHGKGTRKRARVTAYDAILPTKEEARMRLLERCERTIKLLRKELEEAESTRKILKGDLQ